MEGLFDIEWQQMFAPNGSILEPVIRGTIMYLGMFALLRVFRRQAGSVSIADLLLIVIIADAAQNGMAGEAKSVTDAMILIGTILFWDYSLDWLGFRSLLMSKVLEPQPQILKTGAEMRFRVAKECGDHDPALGCTGPALPAPCVASASGFRSATSVPTGRSVTTICASVRCDTLISRGSHDRPWRTNTTGLPR